MFQVVLYLPNIFIFVYDLDYFIFAYSQCKSIKLRISWWVTHAYVLSSLKKCKLILTCLVLRGVLLMQ